VTAVVDVEGVSKHFRLYHERHKSLKERLIHPGGGSYTDLEALKDVSFRLTLERLLASWAVTVQENRRC
jgi:ABC-2 type transport system ATP-binding protein